MRALSLHWTSTLLVLGALVATRTCNRWPINPPEFVPAGTWGGENAGMIAADTIAHVHIGCTFGNTRTPIGLDDRGRFDVPGSYVLRAYPVYVGPELPARFIGRTDGRVLTLSVVVTDTAALTDTDVTLGPVRLTLGREPKMGPCPICRSPAADR